MMKLLFEHPDRLEFILSHRRLDENEYSAHITFNAVLPLKYQKQLADEISDLLGIDVDN